MKFRLWQLIVYVRKKPESIIHCLNGQYYRASREWEWKNQEKNANNFKSSIELKNMHENSRLIGL